MLFMRTLFQLFKQKITEFCSWVGSFLVTSRRNNATVFPRKASTDTDLRVATDTETKISLTGYTIVIPSTQQISPRTDVSDLGVATDTDTEILLPTNASGIREATDTDTETSLPTCTIIAPSTQQISPRTDVSDLGVATDTDTEIPLPTNASGIREANDTDTEISLPNCTIAPLTQQISTQKDVSDLGVVSDTETATPTEESINFTSIATKSPSRVTPQLPVVQPQVSRDKTLIEAVHEGDLELVVKLMKRGIKLTADNQQHTPLYYAAQKYQQHYIPRYIPINWGNSETMSLYSSICIALMNNGDVQELPYGYTPMHYAAQKSNVSFVSELLEAGLAVNFEDKRYPVIFHDNRRDYNISAQNSITVIGCLKDYVPPIWYMLYQPSGAINTYNNNSSVIFNLLASKMTPNDINLRYKNPFDKNSSCDSLLEKAINLCNIDAVTILVKYGARVTSDHSHINDFRPLYEVGTKYFNSYKNNNNAETNHYAQMLMALLGEEAIASSAENVTDVPNEIIMRAAGKDHGINYLRQLFKCDEFNLYREYDDVNLRDRSAIILARLVATGDLIAIKNIRSFNVTFGVDKYQRSPFFYAVQQLLCAETDAERAKYFEICMTLLFDDEKCSTLINTFNAINANLLGILLSNKVDEKYIQELFDAGFTADLEAQDEAGNTVLHYALAYKMKNIAKLLLQQGAKCESCNTNNETPLSIAAKYYPDLALEMINNFYGDINALDNFGASALCYAFDSWSGECNDDEDIWIRLITALVARGATYKCKIIMPGHCKIIRPDQDTMCDANLLHRYVLTASTSLCKTIIFKKISYLVNTAKINVNECDANNFTPLHHCIVRDRSKYDDFFVLALICHGASINLKSKLALHINGAPVTMELTPLDFAIIDDPYRGAVIETLIRGALYFPEVNIFDSATDFAKSMHCEELVKYLQVVRTARVTMIDYEQPQQKSEFKCPTISKPAIQWSSDRKKYFTHQEINSQQDNLSDSDQDNLSDSDDEGPSHSGPKPPKPIPLVLVDIEGIAVSFAGTPTILQVQFQAEKIVAEQRRQQKIQQEKADAQKQSALNDWEKLQAKYRERRENQERAEEQEKNKTVHNRRYESRRM